MRGFDALKLDALKERAATALRPSVEAMLLAALAMGCAQAGWTLLTPAPANAVGSRVDDDSAPRMTEAVALHSPFSPEADGRAAASHAVAALLSSIELNGIRMSADSERHGAMFTMSGGDQRAFIMGQEIADGVTLLDVEDGYVLLGHSGGQHRLDLEASEAFSYARALMGLEPLASAAPEPQPETATIALVPLQGNAGSEGEPARSAPPRPVQERTIAVSALAPSGAGGLFTIAPREEASEHGERAAPKPDSATLAALLASAETGDTLGWRLDEQSATLASAYGLQAGDLILAVNGAGPENLAAVLSAVGSGELRVTIERDGVLQTIVVDRGDRT